VQSQVGFLGFSEAVVLLQPHTTTTGAKPGEGEGTVMIPPGALRSLALRSAPGGWDHSMTPCVKPASRAAALHVWTLCLRILLAALPKLVL